MPQIDLCLTEDDLAALGGLLSSSGELAAILPNGPHQWIASGKFELKSSSVFYLWHIPSGALPLLQLDGKQSWIEDPFRGWTELRTGANSYVPYFGAGWPGVFLLTIHTGNKKSIGMSGVGWIGNRYSAIGLVPNKSTSTFWKKLRNSFKANFAEVYSANDSKWKSKVYTFPKALQLIKSGTACDLNPKH